jgi:hypothetical protein
VNGAIGLPSLPDTATPHTFIWPGRFPLAAGQITPHRPRRRPGGKQSTSVVHQVARWCRAITPSMASWGLMNTLSRSGCGEISRHRMDCIGRPMRRSPLLLQNRRCRPPRCAGPCAAAVALVVHGAGVVLQVDPVGHHRAVAISPASAALVTATEYAELARRFWCHYGGVARSMNDVVCQRPFVGPSPVRPAVTACNSWSVWPASGARPSATARLAGAHRRPRARFPGW